MKISLITVCYNSEKTIEDTLKSVLMQKYNDYEYIIIDGKSSDNTLKILNKYEKKFNGKMKITSERDKGLYDAINKGIRKSNGDIIGLIHSDDCLYDENVLQTIASSFNGHMCDGIYSDLILLDTDMKFVKRKFIAKRGNYKLGWFPPHPTLYLKKNVFKEIGLYSYNYPITSDYDFMIRLMKNKNIKLYYIKKYLVKMRAGGLSTNGLKGYIRNFKESCRVLKDNGIKFYFFVNSIRVIRTIYQMIVSKFFSIFNKDVK